MRGKLEQFIESMGKANLTDRARYCFLAVFLGCVHFLLAGVGMLFGMELRFFYIQPGHDSCDACYGVFNGAWLEFQQIFDIIYID